MIVLILICLLMLTSISAQAEPFVQKYDGPPIDIYANDDRPRGGDGDYEFGREYWEGRDWSRHDPERKQWKTVTRPRQVPASGPVDPNQLFGYSNDRSYLGEWEHGTPSGVGQKIYDGGEKYIGEWRNGVRVGHGILQKEGKTLYFGSWRNNSRTKGFGIVIDQLTEKESYYYGTWKDGQPEGKGTLVSPDGAKYTGGFQFGRPHQAEPSNFLGRYGRAFYRFPRGSARIFYYGTYESGVPESGFVIHESGKIVFGKFNEQYELVEGVDIDENYGLVLQKLPKEFIRGTALTDPESVELYANGYAQSRAQCKIRLNIARGIFRDVDSIPYLNQRVSLADLAEACLRRADKEVNREGLTDRSKAFLDNARRLVDLALDFTPGVSLIKDLASLTTGRNPITGEVVSDTEKAIIAASLFVPAAVSGGSKRVSSMVKHIEGLDYLSETAERLIWQIRRSVKASDESLKHLVSDANPDVLGAITEEYLEQSGIADALMRHPYLNSAFLDHRTRVKVIREVEDTFSQLRNSGTQLSHLTEDFIYSQLVNNKKILKWGRIEAPDVERMVKRYNSIESRIQNTPLSAKRLTVSRGVHYTKKDLNGGVIYTNNDHTAFRLYTGNRTANHRFTHPGLEGLYGVVGDEPSVWETIIDEIRIDHQDMVIAKREFELDNVLDLTDTIVRNRLGVSVGDITVKESLSLVKNPYEVTQIIGHAAKERGVTAILYPSSIKPESTAIVILD